MSLTAPFPLPRDLTLVQSSFSPSPKVLWLYFDREIDVSAINGSQIFVDDGDFRTVRYDASGGVVSHGPTVVSLQLVEIGPYEDVGVKLSANANNGIVAVDDGGTWPGVTNLVLPFP